MGRDDRPGGAGGLTAVDSAGSGDPGRSGRGGDCSDWDSRAPTAATADPTGGHPGGGDGPVGGRVDAPRAGGSRGRLARRGRGQPGALAAAEHRGDRPGTPARRSAAVPGAVPDGGWSSRDAAHAGCVLGRTAAHGGGWHHSGPGRHPREHAGVRAPDDRPRGQEWGVPPAPGGGADRDRHPRPVRRGAPTVPIE